MRRLVVILGTSSWYMVIGGMKVLHVSLRYVEVGFIRSFEALAKYD
jgi:hypothetical protein